MPVVEAAVRNGVAYVDSTGEQEFMTEVYERYADADVAVVPGCGFDFIPGDLTAAVAIADLAGLPTEVAVHTAAMTLPSRGTARTAVEMADMLAVDDVRVRRGPFPDRGLAAGEGPVRGVPPAPPAPGARGVTPPVMPPP